LDLLGELPWRSIAKCGVRPNLVVVSPPLGGLASSFKDRHEAVRVEQLVTNLSVQRFDLSILGRFAGIDEVRWTARSAPQRSMAWLVNSEPLSKRIVSGMPRSKARSSKHRMTSWLPKENPTSRARHSRVKSSTIAIARTFRPFANRSWTKSIDQRSVRKC
jgi:hypothetical protein